MQQGAKGELLIGDLKNKERHNILIHNGKKPKVRFPFSALIISNLQKK